MEILFISHKYPPTIGGMEKQCYELISHAEKNHIVYKLVHTGEQESKFSFFRKLKSRVKKILNEHPAIQIIHLNDGLMGLFCLWLKKYSEIPVIITFHGLDLVFPNYFYQRFISKKFIKYDAAICVSSATKAECLQRNFEASKVFVVPNGVDHQIADFAPNPIAFKSFFLEKYGIDLTHKKIITTLGRPVQRKGFSWFLKEVVPELDENTLTIMVGPIAPPQQKKWWAYLVPKFLKDQIQLAMGGLSDEAIIRQLLQDPDLNKKVVQTGKLPFSQVLEVLSLADLFVMPNIKKKGDAEGFGLVALEASLRQTVVLASELEGITEAIQNNKNGFLLPSANKKEWIETVNKLLQKPEALKSQGEQFQKFTLENYSWEKMTNGYLEVFEKIIKSK